MLRPDKHDDSVDDGCSRVLEGKVTGIEWWPTLMYGSGQRPRSKSLIASNSINPVNLPTSPNSLVLCALQILKDHQCIAKKKFIDCCSTPNVLV